MAAPPPPPDTFTSVNPVADDGYNTAAPPGGPAPDGFYDGPAADGGKQDDTEAMCASGLPPARTQARRPPRLPPPSLFLLRPSEPLAWRALLAAVRGAPSRPIAIGHTHETLPGPPCLLGRARGQVRCQLEVQSDLPDAGCLHRHGHAAPDRPGAASSGPFSAICPPPRLLPLGFCCCEVLPRGLRRLRPPPCMAVPRCDSLCSISNYLLNTLPGTSPIGGGR